MSKVNDLIKRFFENFERGSNTFEGELLGSRFSDPFMVAEPDGDVQVVRRDDFVAGIARRRAFFQSLGFQFVKIVPLEETRLDDHYVMVKAYTQMRFEKEAGQLVDLEDYSNYILFINDDSARIVFYTTHEDLMKIMQDRGLLPLK